MAPEKWTIPQNSWPFRPTREMEEMRRRFEDDVVRPANARSLGTRSRGGQRLVSRSGRF